MLIIYCFPKKQPWLGCGFGVVHAPFQSNPGHMRFIFLEWIFKISPPQSHRRRSFRSNLSQSPDSFPDVHPNVPDIHPKCLPIFLPIPKSIFPTSNIFQHPTASTSKHLSSPACFLVGVGELHLSIDAPRPQQGIVQDVDTIRGLMPQHIGETVTSAWHGNI